MLVVAFSLALSLVAVEVYTCVSLSSDFYSFVPNGLTTNQVFPYSPHSKAKVSLSRYEIEYGIFGEGSQISTNKKRENLAFSLLIGRKMRHFPKNTVLY